MNKRFSSELLERQFLLSAPPTEVLRYLDELSAQIPADCPVPSQPLPDQTVRELFKRNERLIDLGLVRIINDIDCSDSEDTTGDEPRIFEQILARRGEDEHILAACLSNLIYLGYAAPTDWLARRLQKIVVDGTDEQIGALFQNDKVPNCILLAALEKTDVFESLSDTRYQEILTHVLANKLISKKPMRGPDYDVEQHSTIQATWGLLLRLAPTRDHARLLSRTIDKFQEVEVPRFLFQSLKIDKETKSDQFLVAEKAFLEAVLTKWVNPDGERQKWECWDHIRETTVRKLSTTSLERFEDLFLESGDKCQVRGFLSATRGYDLDEKFDDLYKKHKRTFLEGLVENDRAYYKSNRWGKKFYELVRNYKEKSNVDYYESLQYALTRKVDSLAERPDSDEFVYYAADYKTETTNSREESLENINKKLKDLCFEVGIKPGSVKSLGQHLNLIGEMFSLVSRKIDLLAKKSEEALLATQQLNEVIREDQRARAESSGGLQRDLLLAALATISICLGYFLADR